jgi:hypothetical protein
MMAFHGIEHVVPIERRWPQAAIALKAPRRREQWDDAEAKAIML